MVSANAELAPTYSMVTRPVAGTTTSNANADAPSELRIKPREAQLKDRIVVIIMTPEALLERRREWLSLVLR